MAFTGPVTIGGADFTEMQIMASLYGQLLTKAGFTVQHQKSETREAYAAELEAGPVDLVPEHAATFTEFLNREVNGAQATLVASSDIEVTVEKMQELAAERGLAVLAPAKATNQNGFAVTSAFSKKEKVDSLSDLSERGKPVVLAATEDCAQRPFCQLGLERTYDLKFSSSLPLGFGTSAAKQAVLAGQADLVLVGTTDGTLGPLGLKVLADDQELQLADNLIPVLTRKLAADPKVAAALDPLAEKLTTADLARLNQQVDGESRSPDAVATDYLKAEKLL